jgi:hypothetical protein
LVAAHVPGTQLAARVAIAAPVPMAIFRRTLVTVTVPVPVRPWQTSNRQTLPAGVSATVFLAHSHHSERPAIRGRTFVRLVLGSLCGLLNEGEIALAGHLCRHSCGTRLIGDGSG